ncbi:MAG: hypothetical protein AB8E15_11830 [Bdellovibrionales bacterium]
MNSFILILAFSFCLISQAAPDSFNLKLNLSINDQTITSSRFNVEEGKTGLITKSAAEKSHYIEVTPKTILSDLGAEIIELNFEIGSLNPDGVKTILSTPVIRTENGKKASIELSDKKMILKLDVSVNEEQL